jgi:hypothetical protein
MEEISQQCAITELVSSEWSSLPRNLAISYTLSHVCAFEYVEYCLGY